jgi:hypothetical protein
MLRDAAVYRAILQGLTEEISAVTGVFRIERCNNDRLWLRNLQGTIQIGLLPHYIHVVKFGYTDDDRIYDYEDPALIEKIIARCLYLQDIAHHKRNEKVRKGRLAK